MERDIIASVRGSFVTARNELRDAGNGWVLVFVATGWFLVLGTRFIFPAILPEIRATFQISNTVAGGVISAIWAAYALVQFPSGVLSDRLGERLVLTTSTLLATAAVVIVVLSPTLLVFFVGAVLFGLGTGLFAPPRVIVLSNTFADRDSTAIALTFAAGSLGSAMLPFLAGRIATMTDWQVGFAVLVGPFLLVSIGTWKFLPRYSTNVEQAADQSARHVVGRLASAVTDRAVVLSWMGITLSLFVYQGLTAFLPTYLTSVKGLSTGMAATIFGVFFGVGALAQPVCGSLGDRFGRHRVLVGLAAFGAVPLVLLPFGEGVPVLTLLGLLLGVRLGLGPLNNAYIADALPDDVQGVGYGFVRTFHIALGSTGSVIIGYLADRSALDEAFFLLAGISVLSMVVYAGLPALDADDI